jgi:DNA-binding NtrC family response regulator
MESLRILIVDDEEELAFTVAERLMLRGFQAEAATNATDALRRLGEEDFSVLLLDVKMPGIDGLQLMAEIKRRHRHLPVILFTGHGSVADAERGLREGAADYLMKPIDLERLIEKIKAISGGNKGETP